MTNIYNYPFIYNYPLFLQTYHSFYGSAAIDVVGLSSMGYGLT